MGEWVTAAWPVVGQSAEAIPAHAGNLKSEIHELLRCSRGAGGGQDAAAKPIPYDVFKRLSDSVLALLDKVLDQPSSKDLAEAVERVDQTTKRILGDIQVGKHVQGGPAATNMDTVAATVTAAAREEPSGLPKIPLQLAERTGTVALETAEKATEAGRRGQGVALRSGGQAGPKARVRSVEPQAAANAQQSGRVSKLALESQAPGEGKSTSILCSGCFCLFFFFF
jgi:hypothetical protein